MILWIKRNIKIFFNYFSIIIIRLSLKLNFYTLIAFIIYLNLKKLKRVKCEKIKKKIIVLEKSGGIEDILAAFDNKKKNYIGFYCLPRNIIKEIYIFILNNEKYSDYKTHDYNLNVSKKKKEYKKCIYKIFYILNKLWFYDAVISFNIFYFAENDLPVPFKELKKKFLILHKESVYSQYENKIYLKIYNNFNKKNEASKVAVYSKNEKNNLIKSRVLRPNQIRIIGCARSYYPYSYRKIKPNRKQLVYFMIDNSRAFQIKNLNLWQLSKTTQDYLIDYAKKYKDVKIIFKGKKNVHKRSDLPQNMPKNCVFMNSNPGHKFLKYSNVVIAFNSTILIESILANRKTIIPAFNTDISKHKDYIYNTPFLFSFNKQNFLKKINNAINSSFINKDMNSLEKKCIDFYLGNSDGLANIRLRNFIISELNLKHSTL